MRVHRRQLREAGAASGHARGGARRVYERGQDHAVQPAHGSALTAADQLFVTLDPAARLVSGAAHAPFVITDTVGFIRKLPAPARGRVQGHPGRARRGRPARARGGREPPALDEQVAAVESLLGELELRDQPSIVALNKVDRLEGGGPSSRASSSASAGWRSRRCTGQGIDRLVERIGQALRPRMVRATLLIPYRDGPAAGPLLRAGPGARAGPTTATGSASRSSCRGTCWPGSRATGRRPDRFRRPATLFPAGVPVLQSGARAADPWDSRTG